MDRKNSIHAHTDQQMSMKNILKDVPVEGETLHKSGLCVKKEKSSKLRRKSAKSVQITGINKREFILKFVKNEISIVWPREMKIVNSLFKIFPNEEFWLSLTLNFKLNSLCWFLSDEGRKFLNVEYKKFNFEPEKPKSFELKNNDIAFTEKVLDNNKAPLTVREFLKLWQKKN